MWSSLTHEDFNEHTSPLSGVYIIRQCPVTEGIVTFSLNPVQTQLKSKQPEGTHSTTSSSTPP